MRQDFRTADKQDMGVEAKAEAAQIDVKTEKAKPVLGLEATPTEQRDEYIQRLSLAALRGPVRGELDGIKFTVPEGSNTPVMINYIYKEAVVARDRYEKEKKHQKYIREAEKRAHMTESKPVSEAKDQEHFPEFAARLAEEARNGDVRAIWNGDVFDIPQGENSPEAIKALWLQRVDEAHKEYLESPRGVRAREKLAVNINRNQWKVDDLVVQLDTLDFSNSRAVLEWCVKLEKVYMPGGKLSEPTFYGIDGTHIDKDKILQKFAGHGYLPIENDDKRHSGYDPENKDIVAKYIIGDALNCIQEGYPLPSPIRVWYDKWREKFGKRTAKAETGAS